ncbi:hypothetical protein QL285_066994 [Trifolium repens]|nr:hypothetical protein QL285_066994 [Trifolium repens]
MSLLALHHPLSRSIFGGLLLRLSSPVIGFRGGFGRRRPSFPLSGEVVVCVFVFVLVQFMFVLENGGWLLSWWLKEVVYVMELVLTLRCGGGLFLGLRGGSDCRICGFLSTGGDGGVSDLASPGSGFSDDCWCCGEVVVVAVMRLRLMSRDRRLFNPQWCFVSWVFSFRHYWPHGGASVVAETCLLGF